MAAISCPSGEYKILEIRAGDGSRPAPIDHLVHDSHRWLRKNADGRHDDVDFVFGFSERQIRFVLPCEKHVADAALHEGRGRSARAGIEHRHVLVQRGHELTRLRLVAAVLLPRVFPRGKIVPARAARCLRVRRDDLDARLHQIVPVLDALRVALAHEKHDRRRVWRAVVRQELDPARRDQPALRDGLDVVRERERHHVGLEPVDDRARLRARSGMRLADRDFLSARFRRPVLGERFVERAVQLACGIVGDVQERGLRLSGQRTTERQSEHEKGE